MVDFFLTVLGLLAAADGGRRSDRLKNPRKGERRTLDARAEFGTSSAVSSFQGRVARESP